MLLYRRHFAVTAITFIASGRGTTGSTPFTAMTQSQTLRNFATRRRLEEGTQDLVRELTQEENEIEFVSKETDISLADDSLDVMNDTETVDTAMVSEGVEEANGTSDAINETDTGLADETGDGGTVGEAAYLKDVNDGKPSGNIFGGTAYTGPDQKLVDMSQPSHHAINEKVRKAEEKWMNDLVKDMEAATENQDSGVRYFMPKLAHQFKNDGFGLSPEEKALLMKLRDHDYDTGEHLHLDATEWEFLDGRLNTKDMDVLQRGLDADTWLNGHTKISNYVWLIMILSLVGAMLFLIVICRKRNSPTL